MGVFTEITEQLCGTEISARVSRISKLLDDESSSFATARSYPVTWMPTTEVRRQGSIQDVAVLKGPESTAGASGR